MTSPAQRPPLRWRLLGIVALLGIALAWFANVETLCDNRPRNLRLVLGAASTLAAVVVASAGVLRRLRIDVPSLPWWLTLVAALVYLDLALFTLELVDGPAFLYDFDHRCPPGGCHGTYCLF